MTQLTAHFSLEEFTASDTARALGDDNQPTPEHLANLHVTAAGMEKVRSACDDLPIDVSSAYRNPRVNAAVHGVPTSAHPEGWACDFRVRGMGEVEAAQRIQASGIKFDQLIHETGRNILHISFDLRHRMQVLTQAGPAGSPVTQGIH